VFVCIYVFFFVCLVMPRARKREKSLPPLVCVRERERERQTDRQRERERERERESCIESGIQERIFKNKIKTESPCFFGLCAYTHVCIGESVCLCGQVRDQDRYARKELRLYTHTPMCTQRAKAIAFALCVHGGLGHELHHTDTRTPAMHTCVKLFVQRHFVSA